MAKSEKEIKSVNSIIANLDNLKSNSGKYDSVFLHFCITELCERYGQSMRYVTCKLIESGLKSHPLYKEDFEELKLKYSVKCDGTR